MKVLGSVPKTEKKKKKIKFRKLEGCADACEDTIFLAWPAEQRA